MYLVGNVPSNPKDLQAFLRVEFLRISRAIQAMSAATWRDVPVFIWWDQAAGGGPGMTTALRGNVRQLVWDSGVSRRVYGEAQIPHDYKRGTDIYIYAHWSPSTAGSGNVKWKFELTYSKGHNQAIFPATISTSVTTSTTSTQYRHLISEVQLSATSPSGSQIDTDDLEPDGVVALTIIRDPADADDTYNGNALSHGFFLHYQSTLGGTSGKAPPF